MSGEPGEDLTASEAAALAAVAVRTIRHWVAAGLLPARPSRRGRLIQRADLLALLRHKGRGEQAPPLVAASAAASTASAASTAASTDPLAALVRELHEENVRLAGQVGYLQRQVVEQQERILLLTAGSAPPATPPPPSTAVPSTPVEDKEEQPAPWYRRLWPRARHP